jgi:cold shock CspA family protein
LFGKHYDLKKVVFMLHFLHGFIVRDSGGKDVFAHVSALERSDISTLGEGQAVVVDVRGPKGARSRSRAKVRLV